MGMENEKQRRAERKERALLKTRAYGVKMSHQGGDLRRARAVFVVRIRVYRFTPPFVHCASRVALLPPLTRSLRREDRLVVLSDGEQRQVDRLPRITRGMIGIPRLQ